MCAALGKGDNGFWVSVPAGGVAGVDLERRSRLPGYCIVVWRRGHAAGPGDLDPLQADRYRAEVLAAGRAVRARFKPVKLNYVTPGNTVPHVRAHVLPRYQDDPAPGGPVAWEAIVALIRCRRPGCAARPQISAACWIPDLWADRRGACRGLGAGTCCELGVATRGGLRRRRCRTRADAA